jgi:hypothetical protein
MELTPTVLVTALNVSLKTLPDTFNVSEACSKPAALILNPAKVPAGWLIITI